ncbi:MAG: alpha/beta hydrolase [Alphaproteobacteria bacterium]
MTIQPRGRHLTVGDVRLHYHEIAGDGPPLVLLPGITSPAIMWDFASRRLAAFSHVYTLDNRGRGLSSSGDDLEYWLADYAADAQGVIEQLGLESPVVAGHSMGARIALKLAADAPPRVGPLILIDPPVSGPGRRDYPIALQWYLDGIHAASRGQVTEASNPLLKNWTAEQIALRDQWLPTCAVKAVTQSHRSFHEEDVHSLMPAIASPTLLIYAETGGTVTADDAAEITRLIPDSRAVRIDGVGHMIPWDDLETFVGIIENFLREVG